ncbi:MAG: hypothetical protein LC099_01855 [Anaerolineales bacterium]|nr:hypothetical protein [Anaerolineales bacterium]
MRELTKRLAAFLLFAALGGWALFYQPTQRPTFAQQPTGSIATVTGTPSGLIVRVNLDQNFEVINVYAGPSSYIYPSVGVILMGQEIPAFGISEDGQWLQIYYPGVPSSTAWVYGPYVSVIQDGPLPTILNPHTPTPASTPTIEPTLAAALIAPMTATRLPTYTPPPALIVPTFLPPASTRGAPAGLFILLLGFVGGVGTLISFLRGR